MTVNSSPRGSDRETVCPEVCTTDDEIPHGDQDPVNPFRHDLHKGRKTCEIPVNSQSRNDYLFSSWRNEAKFLPCWNLHANYGKESK